MELNAKRRKNKAHKDDGVSKGHDRFEGVDTRDPTRRRGLWRKVSVEVYYPSVSIILFFFFELDCWLRLHRKWTAGERGGGPQR